MPTAAIRPSASIATRSASITVDGRCATTSAVVLREHPAQCFLDLGLGVDVERRQRVVEHEHPRTPQHRAGQGEALPLATGQRQPLLADAGVQPVGQVVHELGLRDRDRLSHVVVRHARAAEGEVLAHAGGEQRRVLERGGDRVPQLVQP